MGKNLCQKPPIWEWFILFVSSCDVFLGIWGMVYGSVLPTLIRNNNQVGINYWIIEYGNMSMRLLNMGISLNMGAAIVS